MFPQISNFEIIHAIREKYDPAVEKIGPHVTLVFPFESNIGTQELREHLISALSGFKPFEVTLSGITGDALFEKFLFLNVGKGKKEIRAMHEKLYTGILEKYRPVWLRDGAFLPHMTVGKIEDKEQFEEAVEETRNITDCFATTITAVSVEIIEENGDSTIEMEIPLNQ